MRAFLFVFASLVTIHATSVAHADVEPTPVVPTVECLSKVSMGSKEVTKEAREIVKADSKSQTTASASVVETERAKDAGSILSALKKLQNKSSLDESENRVVRALCDSDLSVDLAVSL